MSKKAKIFLLLAIMVAAAGLVLYVALAPHRGLSLTFEKGTVYRYRLTFGVDNGTVLFNPGPEEKVGGAAAATVDIAATLILRGYGERDGRWVVGVQMSDIERSAVTFNGKELLSPGEAAKLLAAHEAIVEIAPDGTLGDIRFPQESHPLARNIVKALLAELQTPLSVPAGTTVTETTPYGTATVRFDAADASAGDKVRTRYETLTALGERMKESGFTQQLDSRYTLRTVKGGPYESFKGGETLSVKNDKGLVVFTLKAKLDMKLVGEERFSPDSLAVARFFDRYLREAVDESATSEGAERGLLLQQAQGMTSEELFRTLKILIRSNKIHNSDLFLWRASGLLKLHPELCAELIPIFNDAAGSPESRILIMGLLATAGIPEAQETMLAILRSEEAKTDAMYGVLYQHLTLLPNPSPAVRAMAEQRYDVAKEDPSILRESALTLGAVANNLRAGGDTAGAAEINRRLTGDLAAAAGIEERTALLDSLGNVGDTGNVGTIIGYTGENNDPNVRASAVNALRKNQTPESERTLLGLAADGEPLVQKQALNTLTRYELSEGDIAAFVPKVESGSIEPTFYNDLVNLLGRYVPQYPAAVRAALEAILKHGTDDPMLAVRVKGLIDETLKQGR